MTDWMKAAVLVLAVACGGTALANRDVILVLDNSGSMRKNDPQRLTPSAVAQFIQRQSSDTRVGVVLFSESAELVTPLTAVGPGTLDEFRRATDKLDYTGRWTQTAGAVERALYELRINGRSGALRAVVVMTDGLIDTGDKRKDDELSTWLRSSLAPQAAADGIQIYGLAFTERADFLLLQSLASATGGEYFRALRAEDLDGTLQRIDSTIGNVPRPAPTPAAPQYQPQQAIPTPSAAAAVTAPERVVYTPAVGDGAPATTTGPGGGFTSLLLWALALVALAGLGWSAWQNRTRIAALLPRPGAGSTAAEDGHGLTAVLYDVYDPADIKRHEVGEKPVVIGRVSGSDPKMDYVVVDERTVGRWHATIERRGQTFWIRDEGSVNGTFVNDQRITGEHPLKHGDMVRVHRHEFEFVIPELFDSDRTMIGNPTQMAARGADASGAS
jgi:hypothetical protein